MSDLYTGFHRHFPDMSSPQPGHVRPNPIPQRLSPEPNISDPQAGFQRGLPDMSGPRPGYVRVSDTLTARFFWGAIKGPPHLSSTVGHSFHITNTLRHFLELSTSLIQASPQLSLQVLIHSYSYLKALPHKCLEEKVSNGYSS
jgi:hypothetical protein